MSTGPLHIGNDITDEVSLNDLLVSLSRPVPLVKDLNDKVSLIKYGLHRIQDEAMRTLLTAHSEEIRHSQSAILIWTILDWRALNKHSKALLAERIARPSPYIKNKRIQAIVEKIVKRIGKRSISLPALITKAGFNPRSVRDEQRKQIVDELKRQKFKLHISGKQRHHVKVSR